MDRETSGGRTSVSRHEAMRKGFTAAGATAIALRDGGVVRGDAP
jgi:hypothetical protein